MPDARSYALNSGVNPASVIPMRLIQATHTHLSSGGSKERLISLIQDTRTQVNQASVGTQIRI